MNNDLLRYKSRFLTFALLLGYAYIHTKLTGTYVDAGLKDMVDFSIRLPFGQRLLAPAIAHFFLYFLPLSVTEVFFLLEWLFISLFYFAMVSLLAYEFKPREAQLLSWLFILLLPLITVVNYRYSTLGEATFFYPYDTSSLFFMTIGFLLCLRSRWAFFIPLVFIATINRESSILLVLMIPALHWQQIRKVLGPTVRAMISYFCARLLVLTLIHGTPGHLMEWHFRTSEHTSFEVNLFWLLNEQHLLLFLFCFAGLPLFWFAFFDYIPLQYRPLRYVILFYFIGLLLVGNFIEGRVFTEIAVLFYLPVCVGVSRWLSNLEPYCPSLKGALYYVNRYAVLSILAVIVVFRVPLNNWVIWLLQYSP